VTIDPNEFIIYLMPKRSYTTKRSTYVPRRRATVKKPYTNSRYGNDAFVKIEEIAPLASSAATPNVYSTMRVNSVLAAQGNQYLGDKPEFTAFRALYSRYEVVGMKAETTLNARTTFIAANMAAGFAPNLANPAPFPSEEANNSYPLQVDCNVQGQVSSLYYAYSKDLRNSGATYAIGTTEAYAAADQGIV